MRQRGRILYGLVLGTVLGAWVCLAILTVRGLTGLENMDPMNPPGLRGSDPLHYHFNVPRELSLLWFGDSVSTSEGVAADTRTPILMDLIKDGLKSSLRQGRVWQWQFDPFQSAGYYAAQFEQYAFLIRRRGQYPAVAVIEVNVRSLNRLGDNGFFKLPSAGLFNQADRNTFSVASLYRGLAAWTRAMVVSLFDVTERPVLGPVSPLAGTEPSPAVPLGHDALPGAAPPIPSQNLALGMKAGYQSVYGDGYELDTAAVGSLLHTGEILRAGGTMVLYYLTPVDLEDLRNYCGTATLAVVNRSSALVVAKLKADGFPVLDEHALLNDGFISPPSEHLLAPGRTRLAKALLRWIEATVPLGADGRLRPR